MIFAPLLDTVFLFALGFCGWLLFKLLRLPVAALLGTIFAIGALRAVQVDLPTSPPLLSPVIQVFLGIFVGSRVTRETAKELGSLVLPALVIVAWSVSIVFSLGFFLYHFTTLDLYTGILSSSMGGLPEMTIIALETGADIAVVIVMQSFRMIATVIVFPFILKYWFGPEYVTGKRQYFGMEENEEKQVEKKGSNPHPSAGVKWQEKVYYAVEAFKNTIAGLGDRIKENKNKKNLAAGFAWSGVTLVLAAGGAWLFILLGVPAGAMVGSMIFIAAASVLGVGVKAPSPSLFGLMLIGVGIMVSDNISPETLQALMSGALLLPLFFSTIFIFCSSFLVAFIISKISKWDFPTSFLAAAPGGFTVMTSLAFASGKNPFHVSMLHLCRLLVLKTIVPLAFMFFL